MANGKKKALEINDFTRLKKQSGINDSILNALASCIYWHQERKIGLEAIYIKPIAYDKFITKMQLYNGAPLEEGQEFEIAHVKILKGSFLQTKEILPETNKDLLTNIGEKFPEITNR